MKSFVREHFPRRFVPLARRFYYRFQAIPYLGTGVTCPCCEHQLRCFLPYGENVKRPNALCPFCQAVERHRLLWLYLHNCTNLFRDKLSVLHFAPEYAFERELKRCSNLDYITTDLDNPAMVKADISALPFSDQRFDAILCSHVLEYVPDDRKAMRELHRVLKPGGWVIILGTIKLDAETTSECPTPVAAKERSHISEQHDDVLRIYGGDCTARLEQAGFCVRQDIYAQELDSDLVQRYGLPVETPILYCTRPTE